MTNIVNVGGWEVDLDALPKPVPCPVVQIVDAYAQFALVRCSEHGNVSMSAVILSGFEHPGDIYLQLRDEQLRHHRKMHAACGCRQSEIDGAILGERMGL